MLISSLHHIKQSGGEHRNMDFTGRKLTSSHLQSPDESSCMGSRTSTLSEETPWRPKVVEGGGPSSSTSFLPTHHTQSQWDRAKWASDKWGRNKWYPQGNATMRSSTSLRARNQSLAAWAILYPHGILFETRRTCVRRSSLPTL